MWSRPDQAERFIREYADPILRVCAAYSLGRADAQDICQDIFLTLLEREQAFQGPEHERAFILRCAINACKDLLKSSRLRRTAPLEEAERVAAPRPGRSMRSGRRWSGSRPGSGSWSICFIVRATAWRRPLECAAAPTPPPASG